jgi:hypothetical protein
MLNGFVLEKKINEHKTKEKIKKNAKHLQKVREKKRNELADNYKKRIEKFLYDV